jgi:ApbE superfamily uncharacterized protein (UPF0280 family)
MRQPQIALLSDGRRLHLQDGPIDLVIEAFGAEGAVIAAYAAATQRFAGLLDELVAELPLLRSRARGNGTDLAGVVARRMHAAVAPFAEECFITPMAAVAGAVADEILQAMRRAAPLASAYVNNGGDIALHLERGKSFALGLVDRPDRPSLCARAKIAAQDPSRGVATSGWRGRSFSLGIADAVTILAATAAQADAAATIVANAVDLPGHPAVSRVPAASIAPDNDLGDILVTRAVGALMREEVDEAIERGLAHARGLHDRGLIHAAAIHLQGETRVLVTKDIAAPRLSPAFSTTSLQREIVHV